MLIGGRATFEGASRYRCVFALMVPSLSLLSNTNIYSLCVWQFPSICTCQPKVVFYKEQFFMVLSPARALFDGYERMLLI